MLTSVDLFSGCGGMSRGLENAGFHCLAFNEINKSAADSFQLNFPDALRFEGDIRTALSNEIIEKEIFPLVKNRDIDLVCGGPPCQGFSGIGHRRSYAMERKEIPTNHLFYEMIRVIKKIKPNAFLFENVRGILSSKWTKEGEKGEIFRDVWNGFKEIEGYQVQPTLLHGYGFGVPQNRPRVMIMGIKNEIINHDDFNVTKFDETKKASTFHTQLKNNGGLFPIWNGNLAPDIIDVLSDLDFEGWTQEKARHRKKPRTDFQRKMREKLGENWRKHELHDHSFSNHSERVKLKFEIMHENDGKIPEEMKTKKFSQKIIPKKWGNKMPSITVTSMPDDYVHYSKPRTLSVREWARLQTFPDHHRFSGKRTTGGMRRAGNPRKGVWDREVPKYTQIGNAVPPMLAEAVGNRISEILNYQSNDGS